MFCGLVLCWRVDCEEFEFLVCGVFCLFIFCSPGLFRGSCGRGFEVCVMLGLYVFFNLVPLLLRI